MAFNGNQQIMRCRMERRLDFAVEWTHVQPDQTHPHDQRDRGYRRVRRRIPNAAASRPQTVKEFVSQIA